MEVLTRKAAKSLSQKFYFTGKPCKHDHITTRRVSNGHCTKCSHISSTTYGKGYRKTLDPAKAKKYQVKWRADNPLTIRGQAKRWRQDNPAKCAAKAARERAAKLQRTPTWLSELDELLLQEIYQHCKDLTEITDITHHVDHDYPLNGKLVSGLHVPSNLQIITEHENCTKGAKFIV